MTTTAPAAATAATPQNLDATPYLRLIDALISFRNEKDEIIGVQFANLPGTAGLLTLLRVDILPHAKNLSDRTRYAGLYSNVANARSLDSVKQKYGGTLNIIDSF